MIYAKKYIYVLGIKTKSSHVMTTDTTRYAILLIVVVTAMSCLILLCGQIDDCEARRKEREKQQQKRWRDPIAWQYYQKNPHLRSAESTPPVTGGVSSRLAIYG